MATYPVLPLADAVLLPGMVIPVTLDAATQAAVDAARTTSNQQVLAVPRLDGEYGSVGTLAVIEKVGRLPSGEPAAVVRGLSRARIGSGVPTRLALGTASGKLQFASNARATGCSGNRSPTSC